MQKKMKAIFLAIISFCGILRGGEYLELQSISGLNKNETIRFLID